MNNKYISLAKALILNDIGMDEKRLDLVGRILSLKKSHLVEDVDVKFHIPDYSKKKRKMRTDIELYVILSKSLKEQNPDQVETKIRKMLDDNGIDSSKLFQYAGYSYGIEDDTFDFWIGIKR
jgi:hypothetical protein